jgi:hypothetical protein
MNVENDWTDDEIEEIVDNGEFVFENFWEASGSSVGIDANVVIKYEDQYFACPSTGELFGPYNTLDDALDVTEMTWLWENAKYVTCTELSAGQLADRLDYFGSSDITVSINGERWQASPGGTFEKLSE